MVDDIVQVVEDTNKETRRAKLSAAVAQKLIGSAWVGTRKLNS